jgi:hypothetical protein
MKGRLERDIKLNMFMTKAKNLLSQIDNLADSLDVRLVNIVSVIRDIDEDEQANVEAMYLFNVADSQEMFDMMSHAVEAYEKESKDTKKNNRLSATDDLFDGFISLN